MATRDGFTSAAQRIQDGVLSFDREVGRYTLSRGPSYVGYERLAPRVLQIGLLTPCNLSCHFCYRDTKAPSRLSKAFLVPFLQEAAEWGVLEVAFGGGEPLLFRDFVPMLRALHETTHLGLNFTTNGMLLTDSVLDALHDCVGEIRISAYPTNGYRATLKRTQSFCTGLNLLVTPENVGQVEVLVHDALSCGADNVLLLGYKGEDSTLHLSEQQRERLRVALVRLHGLPLRLDICLYPYFSDLSHLFVRGDCDAGDDFLVITPDKAVQACSFAQEKQHFETFEELQALYYQLQRLKPRADVSGCTRPLFSGVRSPIPVRDTVWHWEGRASNNSGDWTVIADFCDENTAKEAAGILQNFFVDLHSFFNAWNEENGKPSSTLWSVLGHFAGTLPPPVQEFVAEYKLDVDQYKHGITDSTDAPSIVYLGKRLLMYHGYCLALDSAFLQVFFDRFTNNTAVVHSYGLDHHFLLEADATGNHADVVEALEDFFSAPDYEYETLPWLWSQQKDPRLWPHEMLSEMLVYWEPHSWDLQITSTGLSMALVVHGNLPTGCCLLEQWLKEHGYSAIDVRIKLHRSF